MDCRAFILVGGVFAAALAGAGAGCRAPDPAAITFSERPASGSTDPASGTPTPGPADGGGAAADPIFGTEAYVYQDPGQVANNAATEHNGTVEGKDCVVTGCHLDAPAAPKWLIAGTIYSAINGGTTVAKAEVRVLGPDGTEVAKAYADANGNFWLDKAGDIPAGSKVGVRSGAAGAVPQHMTTTLGPGQKSCNSTQLNCHGTPTTGKISAN